MKFDVICPGVKWDVVSMDFGATRGPLNHEHFVASVAAQFAGQVVYFRSNPIGLPHLEVRRGDQVLQLLRTGKQSSWMLTLSDPYQQYAARLGGFPVDIQQAMLRIFCVDASVSDNTLAAASSTAMNVNNLRVEFQSWQGEPELTS